MLRLILLVLCAGIVQSKVVSLSNFTDLQLPNTSINGSTNGAPKYNEALKSFNSAYTKMMYLLFPYIPDKKGITNTPVRLVFVVLDGIINILAEIYGGNYNGIYESQAVRLYSFAEDNPERVSKRLLCVLHSLNDSIKTLKAIRNSKKVDKLCKQVPTLCNDILQAIIDADDDKGLAEQAKILLSLGSLSDLYPLYEKLLSPVVKRKDDWGALEFLVKYKKTLRPLLMAVVNARNLDLGKDKCEKLRDHI